MLFKDAGKDFYKNPIIVFPAIFLWVFIIVFSRLSVGVNYRLSNGIAIAVWLVLFSIVTLIVISFVFSGLIGMCKSVINHRGDLRDFLSNSRRFWFRNFQIMLLVVVVSIVIGKTAHYGALFFGRAFGLPVSAAQVLFVLIYFTGLVGVLMFLSFSSFYLVIYDLKVKESVLKSVGLVGREYLGVLSMSVMFFVLFFLLGRVEGIVGEVIEYVLVVPFLSVFLTRFVLRFGG